MNKTRAIVLLVLPFLLVGVTGCSDVQATSSAEFVNEMPEPSFEPVWPWLYLSDVCFIAEEPNSVGGVSVYGRFRNSGDSDVSNTPIKYIRFVVTPYNGVGDAVASEIGGESTIGINFTGPLAAIYQENKAEVRWDNVWYNSTIKTLELESFEIEYMDGTTVTAPVTESDFDYDSSWWECP